MKLDEAVAVRYKQATCTHDQTMTKRSCKSSHQWWTFPHNEAGPYMKREPLVARFLQIRGRVDIDEMRFWYSGFPESFDWRSCLYRGELTSTAASFVEVGFPASSSARRLESFMCWRFKELQRSMLFVHLRGEVDQSRKSERLALDESKPALRSSLQRLLWGGDGACISAKAVACTTRLPRGTVLLLTRRC